MSGFRTFVKQWSISEWPLAHGKLGAKRVLSRRIHTACLPQFSINCLCTRAKQLCFWTTEHANGTVNIESIISKQIIPIWPKLVSRHIFFNLFFLHWEGVNLWSKINSKTSWFGNGYKWGTFIICNWWFAKTFKIYNEQVKGCSYTASKGVVFT